MYIQNFSQDRLFLKVCTYFIPNDASFVSLATSYFSSNRIYLNARTNYFQNVLPAVKNIMHNRKANYISYTVCRVVPFKNGDWLKSIIFIK